LEIFYKNDNLILSKVTKGTSVGDCASNGTKFKPMRLTVQEIQRAQEWQNARV
jgi:hypothetical protein